MGPVDDHPAAVLLQDDVGRIEIAVAELGVALHAVEALQQLVACARIEVRQSIDLLGSLVDRVAEADRLELAHRYLDIDELLEQGVEVVRLVFHFLGKGLAFDEVDADRPSAVDLLHEADGRCRNSVGFDQRSDVGFIEDAALRMLLRKYFYKHITFAIDGLVGTLDNDNFLIFSHDFSPFRPIRM